MSSPWVPKLALAALIVSSLCRTGVAQANRTVADGVYSDRQAQRGQAVYDLQCRACHGATLAGELGPPLAGTDFLRVWDTLPLADLVDKIQHTMPATSPGTLSRAQATDIVAYLLKVSAFPTGPAELRADDTLKQTALVGPTAASPAAVAPPGAAALQVSFARPSGNMAQVMRGILFPSSNLIFNVQNQDPGEQKVGWSPGTTSFSWVDWGAGIYSGWELVDYAAIALVDSAPLLLTPGRRCENGKPVPVERADWVRYTAELADAGRAAYRASQSRNREAVIELTNRIADACLQCHEAYRDKPGGTTFDPSNKAARC
ncbi:MAG: Quinoprotein glucose dehydrogenase [Acidobacteria bacterium]|nr:Quinoprotein glucose dehydrogenase [Acidobacteriota bacterium]